MADRVRPQKLEAPATGGTELDEWPTAVDPSEDHIDARGYFVQNDSSDDEVCHITRDASSPDNLTFADGVQTTPVTLTDLLGGAAAALLGKAIFKVDGGLVYTTDGDVCIKEVQ